MTPDSVIRFAVAISASRSNCRSVVTMPGLDSQQVGREHRTRVVHLAELLAGEK
jgi:hypothetical protein